VPLPEFDIVRDRRDGIAGRTHRDPSVAAGEVSIARLLIDLDHGSDEWVALPVYPSRGFVERSVWTARTGPVTALGELIGRRVAISNWLSTHSVWVRIALRRHGADPEAIHWVIGGDGGAPASATVVASTPLAELAAGRVDAAVLAHEPPPSLRLRLRRVIGDVVATEAAPLGQGGRYPAYHVVAVRSWVAEKEPAVCLRLLSAIRDSARLWERNQWASHVASKVTPWYEDELERVVRLLGREWRDGGFGGPRGIVNDVAGELRRDGSLARRWSSADVFRGYRGIQRRAS
jgi:4,5-dihydroxyphthalate decarboxylase